MHTDRNDTTNIKNIITYYLLLFKSNWVLFVLSVTTCCLVACLHIYSTPKKYKSDARIMVKEGSWQGLSGLDEMTILSEIYSSFPKANIYNEIELLRSKKLMNEVIDRLQLDVRYYMKGRVRNVEIYSSPIKVSFLEEQKNEFSFVLIPITEESVIIKNFKGDSINPTDYEREICLGDTISTPVGKMVIFRMHCYAHDEYLNQAFLVRQCNIKNTEMHFSENLTVSATKNSDIIKLSVRDYSLARAEKILNTLLSVYNEDYNAYKKQVLKNTTAFINGRIEAAEQELEQMEKINSNIDRYLKPQENLYLYLLQKREMNELAKTVTTNYTIIDKAMGNDIPLAPQKGRIIFFAIIIGILIPCLVLLIKGILKTTVQFPKDVVDNISIPFMGIIPKCKKSKEKTKTVFTVKNDIHCPVSESFRMVCSNVDFLKTNNKDNVKRIMITSPEDNSGKSFVALNLATHLAVAGKRVALLDLNFRKATISELIDCPAIGIANYLADTNLSIDEIAQKEQFQPGLDVFPTGTLPANSIELLFGNRLSKLMDNLDQLYDYILIDTTSIKVADASVISTMAEMTLFVIQENVTGKHRIAELENLYEENRYKNMVILYNGLQNS